MPPGGKPAQCVGRNTQGQNPRKNQGRAGQGDGTHASGTKIRNNQERAEENQRRAEVIHQRQQSADHHGIGNEQNQIPLVHNPVHGGRAGVDKTHLGQLRGLQRQSADDQPVLRAIVFRAEQQRNDQEAHARQHRQIPEAFGPLQIPQGPADHKEHQNTQNHGRRLLAQLLRLHRGNGRHAQSAQKKGQRLHLKGASAYHQIEEKQHPLADRYGTEAQEIGPELLLRPVQQESCQHNRLQQRQNQQPQQSAPAAGAPGPQLGLKLLLPLGNNLQLHIHTADGNGIPLMDGTDIHFFPVDPGPGFGTGIRNRPAAIVISRKYRVISGHR